MKKLFTIFCLAIIGLLTTNSLRAEVGDTFTNGDFTFKVLTENPNTVTVYDYLGGTDANVPSQTENGDIQYTVIQIGISEGEAAGTINGFFSNKVIESVTLPNSIQIIGPYSFSGCRNLKEINIPSSVTFIGDYAFYNCESLTSMTLPENLENISITSFGGCSLETLIIYTNADLNGVFTYQELTSVVFGDNVTSIPSFNGASKLLQVTLPSMLITIPDNAFSDCISLNSIILPSTLQTIGSSAFSECSISSLEIPSSVTSIENSAFANNNLTTITLPKTLQSVGSGAFYGCPIETLYVNTNADINGIFSYRELTKAVFSDDATAIPSFSGASKLSDIILPSPMTNIPDNAFTNCTSLKTINLPSGLQSIGANAFAGCSGLSSIEIPANVTSIGDNAFANTPLTSIVLPNDLVSISEGTFSNCVLLQSVQFPTNLKSIGNQAFYQCGSLSAISLPNGTETIGESAFSNSGLLSVRLPENVTTISKNLFANCRNLEKVYLSENVNTFGESAFQNCVSLRSLIIPEGVESIPTNLMNGCTSLVEILIPNSVETISANAFQGCMALKNIVLGSGLYTIGDYAFADCPNIADIHSLALNPPIAESYTFPTKAYTNAMVTVREQSLATYNRENPWYRFQNYLTVSGAISLSHYNVDMAGNEVFQLGVYGSDSKIIWSSSNPSVAYANECGLIVAMGITGATVITATVDGEEINCNVTVSSPYRDPQAYTRATSNEEDLQPVDIIMEGVGGNPPMVNVRLVPVGSKTIIDWTSSDPSLATVENGLVTIIEDGDVDFGVETENGLEEVIEIDLKDVGTSGIEEMFQNTDVMMPISVFDLNGRIIYFNATLEQIKNLDKGLYIIQGKKVLVK